MQDNLHDSLDLEALFREGLKIRRTSRWRIIRAALITIVLIGVMLNLNAQLHNVPAGIYYLKDNQWQRISLFALPHTLEVSSDGTVWAMTRYNRGLARHKNGITTVYNADDFKAYSPRVRMLTTFEDELWGWLDHSVIYFDGEQWQRPIIGLRSNTYVDMAASHFGVMLVEEMGSIHRFDRSRWFYELPFAVLPDFTMPDRNEVPTLETAPDGSIWMSYGGIWRFDGERWETKVNPSGVKILSIDNRYVWYLQGQNVTSLDHQTGEIHTFPLDTFLIRQSASIRGMIKNLLVTDEGIFRFDGTPWNHIALPLPPFDRASIGGMGIDPDEVLWVNLYDETFFTPENGEWLFETNMLLTVFPLLIIIPIIAFTLFPHIRWEAHRSKNNRELLLSLLPELPTYTPLYTDAGRFSRYIIVIFILLMFGFPMIAVAFQFPPFLATFFILSSMILMATAPVILRLFGTSIDDESRSHLYQLLKASAALAVLLSFIMGGTFVGLSEAVKLLNIHPAFSLLIVLFSAFIFTMWTLQFLLMLLVRQIYGGPLARGNYQETIRMMEQFESWMPSFIRFDALRIGIYEQKGELEKAEQLSTQELAYRQNTNTAAIVPIVLAYSEVLELQKRHHEALKLIEGGLRMMPEHYMGYLQLAKFYVEMEAQPERALMCLDYQDRLIFNLRPWTPNYLRSSHLLSRIIRALALAQAGRRDESETLLNQLMNSTKPDYKPGLAAFFIYAGQIKIIHKDYDTAHDYFTRASEIDPDGFNSTAARELLSMLPTAPT